MKAFAKAQREPGTAGAADFLGVIEFEALREDIAGNDAPKIAGWLAKGAAASDVKGEALNDQFFNLMRSSPALCSSAIAALYLRDAPRARRRVLDYLRKPDAKPARVEVTTPFAWTLMATSTSRQKAQDLGVQLLQRSDDENRETGHILLTLATLRIVGSDPWTVPFGAADRKSLSLDAWRPVLERIKALSPQEFLTRALIEGSNGRSMTTGYIHEIIGILWPNQRYELAAAFRRNTGGAKLPELSEADFFKAHAQVFEASRLQ